MARRQQVPTVEVGHARRFAWCRASAPSLLAAFRTANATARSCNGGWA
ncbi:hypothetical protein [Streptomyces milbemycinicus]|uniref:Uncharacterized protein n=1 Tax=Streptomyces milbemycinicus TaxID=476552 RepID=A0ABW8LYJ9_9ACTN